MTTVIVPLDGSTEAERAIDPARALAGEAGQLVLLVSTWHDEPVAPRRYLEERARPLAGPDAETRVVLDQRPSEAILAIADEQPDALVCMATHGRNALGRAVLGSTAEAVVAAAAHPLVLVGPHATTGPAPAEGGNLLLAVDDPESATLLVRVATELTGRLGFHPWVVEAVASAPFPFVADAEVARVEAPGLDAAGKQFEAHQVSADTKVLLDIDPVDAIVRFAEELPASLVLMGTHGRRGAARLVLGSVAMGVVHRSPCPVMVVRQ